MGTTIGYCVHEKLKQAQFHMMKVPSTTLELKYVCMDGWMGGWVVLWVYCVHEKLKQAQFHMMKVPSTTLELNVWMDGWMGRWIDRPKKPLIRPKKQQQEDSFLYPSINPSIYPSIHPHLFLPAA